MNQRYISQYIDFMSRPTGLNLLNPQPALITGTESSNFDANTRQFQIATYGASLCGRQNCAGSFRSWRRYEVETFHAFLVICVGNPSVTTDSASKSDNNAPLLCFRFCKHKSCSHLPCTGILNALSFSMWIASVWELFESELSVEIELELGFPWQMDEYSEF